MIRQNKIEHWLGDKLVYAVLEAFHKRGIKTWHMAPAPRTLGVAVGPTTITLSIDLRNPESDLAKALKMSAIVKKYVAEVFMLPEDSFFDVHITDGVRYVLVTVPHPKPWFPSYAEVEDLARDDMILGVDMFNRVVYYDMWNAFSTAIASGRPGAGKSNTLRLLTIQALNDEWRVFLIAAKGTAAGRDSSEWEDIAPYCERVAVKHHDADGILSYIDKECEARADGKKPVDRGILLVVDELLEMSTDQLKSLGKLIRVRRTAGFRALMGTKVVGKLIPQDIRASAGYRLVHMSATYVESQNATGMAGLGAEKLQRGEVIMVDPESKVTRLVIAKADIEDIAKILPKIELIKEPIKEPIVKSEKEMAEPQKLENEAKPVTLNTVLEEWEKAASESGKGLVAPPVWMLSRGIAYFQRHGKLPPHRLLTAWHTKRVGKGMSDVRRKMCRNGISRVVAGIA